MSDTSDHYESAKKENRYQFVTQSFAKNILFNLRQFSNRKVSFEKSLSGSLGLTAEDGSPLSPFPNLIGFFELLSTEEIKTNDESVSTATSQAMNILKEIEPSVYTKLDEEYQTILDNFRLKKIMNNSIHAKSGEEYQTVLENFYLKKHLKKIMSDLELPSKAMLLVEAYANLGVPEREQTVSDVFVGEVLSSLNNLILSIKNISIKQEARFLSLTIQEKRSIKKAKIGFFHPAIEENGKTSMYQYIYDALDFILFYGKSEEHLKLVCRHTESMNEKLSGEKLKSCCSCIVC